jgi:hypothetical protein
MPDDASPEVKQTRMKEFMQLLPLTLELAGLPKAGPAQLFNTDQIEARIMTIRNAYKQARQLLREIGEGT